MDDKQHCGQCGKRIYYGLFCSNDCAEDSFNEWREEQQDKAYRTADGYRDRRFDDRYYD